MAHMQQMLAASETVLITLSGHSVNATALSGTATATLDFQQDGTVDQLNNGSRTQIDTATDWIIPNSAAPGTYEARFTNLVGDAITAPVAEDAWHAISTSDFELSLQQVGAGSKSATFDVEIRRGSSGAAIASGEYTLSAGVS